ncbi:hypothetical protein N865_12505 [Intrasporangium oryzae NRRL B-24470]|uniref:Tetratricopeptide repeat protein n=1 Tax=Intrasporangium oryzae NRRL B-24470 TaxID=1386089 RepID=W9G6W0_9MICO|nr:hypothetical protein [Intrasporangium oryzae]EWT01931.1 hypothetical protein N865_12505 [Intrasporangium oryzae NRRL B-24470]
MTTLSSRDPDPDQTTDDGRPGLVTDHPQQTRTRRPFPEHLRRRRRRLLLGSAPVVAMLVLLALRLLTLNVVHGQTRAAYDAGDRQATLHSAARQGWLNVVETFRAPFANGDAHVLGGHFDLARPWFEQAFELVPKGGIDECKVRVNLGLTYEALGDAAKARDRTLEWKQFYDKGIAVTRGRPPLCDAPEGSDTGRQLQQAEQRMEQKDAGQPGDTQPAEPQQSDPEAAPRPEPSPDPGRTPSQQDQERLQEQQRQNTIERNLEQGQGDLPPADPGQTYPRPW